MHCPIQLKSSCDGPVGAIGWLTATAVFVLSCFPLTVSGQRIQGSVPAQQVPAWQLQQPQRTIDSSPDISYLRQPKPRSYLLDSGDVLGIFLEGVLGEVDGVPPIHYPPAGSSLGPSMGFPIVVRESGAISLPLVDPIPVRGLTIQQAEALIKSVYLGHGPSGKKILNDKSRIIVTLQRQRTVNVVVIRQDNSRSMRLQGAAQANRGPVFDRSDRSARSSSIQLPAYENDVLHALMRTGGLPGVNAARDVRVYRSGGATASRSTNSSSSYRGSNSPFPRTGYSPNGFRNNQVGSSSVSIPLQRSSNYRSFDNRQSVLTDGDILVVGSRPTEVYYTSGLLRSAEHPLPRDNNLTVLEAVALAGGPTGSASAGGLGISRLQPTELNVVRNNGRNGQVTIRVDLDRALTDPSQQILVAPGDHLILRHKPIQQIGNFGIGTFNNVGLRRIFQ